MKMRHFRWLLYESSLSRILSIKPGDWLAENIFVRRRAGPDVARFDGYHDAAVISLRSHFGA